MHPGLLTRLRSGSRRVGATMLMTVLIVLASATIAALVVKVMVDAQGSQQRRLATLQAREQVTALESQVIDDLAVDPLRPFAEVLQWESPRVCEGDLTGHPNPIEPGEPWPASCGPFWSYAGSSDDDSGVRLYPPGPDGSSFILESFARVGNQYAGSRTELVAGGRQRPALLVADDVDLDALSSGSVTLDGAAYAAGTLDPGTTVIADGTLLASENDVDPRPVGTLRIARPDPAALSDDLDIRTIYPLELTASQLQSSLESLRTIACLDDTAENVFEYSTGLCLTAGKTLVDTDDAPVAVPSSATAAAFLIVTENPGQVTVYSRASTPAAWPDTLASWGEPLGVFQLPASGVIFTDRATVIGHCAESAGVCTDWQNDGQPGMTIDDGITFVVGTPTTPADLYIGGPLNTDETGPAIGAVVSGAVRVPAGAAPAGTSLNVDLWLGILGLDGDIIAGDPADGPGTRPSVTLNGSLLLPRPLIDIPAFTAVNLALTSNPALIPPFFPAPGIGFSPDTASFIADDDLQLILPTSAFGPTAPVAPLRLTVTADENGDTLLAWQAPSNGGSAITDYIIEYSSGGDYVVYNDGVSAGTRVTVTGLSNGTAHTFKVTAVNAEGSGAAAVSAAFTPGTVPETPSISTMTATASSVTVSWGAVASNGGPVTSYNVELATNASFTSGIQSTTIAGTSHVFTGLNIVTTYYARVTATNAVGTSQRSATSSVTTPANTPGAPTLGTITPGDQQLSVAFTAPASDGGASITTYQYSTDNGVSWRTRTAGTTASPLVITTISGTANTTLVNGVSYQVQLRAVNSAGEGAASTATAATPVSPTHSVWATGPAAIAWNAVGGANSYTANASPSLGAATISGTTATFASAMTAGVTYTFTVQALNSSAAVISTGVVNARNFAYTGAAQAFALPAGTATVYASLCGARGGAYTPNDPAYGLGGCSIANLSATAGTTVNIYVGGKGGDHCRVTYTAASAPACSSGSGWGAGGWNGGGTGGTGGATYYGGWSGGGGGATDIRIGGTAIANRILIAGGGGGTAHQGGHGGGLTGQAGTNGHASGSVGGGGGTQSAGGTGGARSGYIGGNGGAGSLGTGGTGGNCPHAWCFGGGGGGGGYYGGGGGESGDSSISNTGAGGGGGSSFAHATQTSNAVHNQGTGPNGNGSAVLSWTTS